MERTDIKPGVYVLVTAQPAIKLDKRMVRDWRAAPIPAGTEFVVGDAHFSSTTVLEIHRLGAYSHHVVLVDRLPDGFVASLAPVESLAPSQFLASQHCAGLAEDILDRLEADGVVTMEQVKTALARVIEAMQ
jgi:hypothetical protein